MAHPRLIAQVPLPVKAEHLTDVMKHIYMWAKEATFLRDWVHPLLRQSKPDVWMSEADFRTYLGEPSKRPFLDPVTG